MTTTADYALVADRQRHGSPRGRVTAAAKQTGGVAESKSPAAPDGTVRKKKKLLNGPNLAFTFPSGSTYVGGFKDGKLHGVGTYTYVPSGDVYEGQWKADLKHGQGTYSYANGDKYAGEWYMGKKHGKGRFVFASGDDYSGAWKDDKMDGYGVFSLLSNGNRYSGYWQNGIRQGRGTLHSGNGDVYEGEWVAGKEDGMGILCQVNSDVYCGEWRDGLMDGKGVLRDKGILFYVEYMGGYKISQVRVDDEEAIEEGWEKAMRMYVDWLALHPDGIDWGTAKGAFSASSPDADALRTENCVLRARIEYLLRVLSSNVSKHSTDDVSTLTNDELVTSLQRCQACNTELQKTVEQLRTTTVLLEGSLVEKMLEQRRLKEELRIADTALEEMEAEFNECHRQLLHLRKKRRKEQHFDVSPGEAVADAEEAADVGDDDGEEDDTESRLLEEARQANGELVRQMSELKVKVAFLGSENAELQERIGVLEENNEDLNHRYEEVSSLLSEAQQKRESEKSAPVVEAPKEDTPKEDAPSDLKQLEENTLAQQLVRSNQLNVELRLENDRLEKELEALTLRRRTKADAAQKGSNENPEEGLEALNLKLRKAEAGQLEAERVSKELERRLAELSAQHTEMLAQKAADPSLLASLERKMDQIATLEADNATMARELEELRAQVEEDEAAVRKASKQRRASATQLDGAAADVTALRKDLKKAQKKLKKAVEDRNGVALELYETRLELARARRLWKNWEGSPTVVALLRGGDTQEATAVRVSETDAAQLALRADDEERLHVFDHCFSPEATVDTVFTEISAPLGMVCRGFQVAYVTLGEMHSGKSFWITKLLPMMVEQVCVSTNTDATLGVQPVFQTSFRVAAVEVSSSGALDLASSHVITSIQHDDHGYVIPAGASFVDCGAANVMTVVEKLLQQRSQVNGRSHVWLQIQCVTTHRVAQTCTTGRLTIMDLCGLGDLETQLNDVESARFANRSFQSVKEVFTALKESQRAVPYSKEVETALLFDLLGGNAITTVLGTLHTGADHITSTAKVVGTLTCVEEIRNGPLYQSFASADTLRWREIVAALSSEHQAEQQLVEVDDLREE